MVNRFIVINKHHIEKDYLKIMIKNNKDIFDRYQIVELSNLKEVFKVVPMNEDNYVTLLGFLYSYYDIPENYREGLFGNINYISNIGSIPKQFNSIRDDYKDKSLAQQLMLLLNINNDAMYKDACYLSNYLNFIGDDYKTVKNNEAWLMPPDMNYIKLTSERAFEYDGLFVLYENNPKNKVVLAHEILDNREEGIVIIGAQTKSDNDILTVYCKGLNTTLIANKFGVVASDNSNVFNVFVPSIIDNFGKQTVEFLSERM